MYESAWYDSGQLVPDQVTPASDELPIVNGTASAGISTSYSRGDHIHPQQLTYDNNITATKFIKTGETNQQILLADGTNKAITDFNTSIAPRAYQIDPADGMQWMYFAIKWNLRIQNGYNRRFEVTQLGQVQTDFMICADTPESSLILRSYMKVFTNSLRISRSTARCGIYLRTGLAIGLSNQSGAANRGLQISADGNTLTFNGSVIAGTGATMAQIMVRVGTEDGFYSNGSNIYWLARTITLGAVPP
ncbi:MAG: hypothetical protein EZS28_021688 [Streblomastix strix]|uniref:Uncharacterized protein n=1 Tax=Streblomastix strix TaxID=222440 RepID=A0A5J4VJU1_9EUKA|nr:MAG: hypothetical protein EZS28_021688 [Streblomastix strix]